MTPSRPTHLRTRRLGTLGLFLFCLTWTNGIFAAPADVPTASLEEEIERYRALGLADPREGWEAYDYYKAIEILETLPASSLPRLDGSRGSALLFSRLLVAREDATQGILTGRQGRTLVNLYAAAVESDASLWDELVAISHHELEMVLQVTVPIDEIEGMRKDVIEMFETASGEYARSPEELVKHLSTYDQYERLMSHAVRSAVEALILLGNRTDMPAEPRAELVSRLQSSLPVARTHMTEGDRTWIVELLRASSRLPQNSDLSGNATSLAELLDPHSAAGRP